jgi:hypothetical protein
LCIKLSNRTFNALDRLCPCTDDLQHWFWQNGLLLNPGKSAVVYFGTRNHLPRTDLTSPVTTAGCDVSRVVSDRLTVLSVTLDSKLSIDHLVNNMVNNCNYHLQALRLICSSVPRDLPTQLHAQSFTLALATATHCYSTCLNLT